MAFEMLAVAETVVKKEKPVLDNNPDSLFFERCQQKCFTLVDQTTAKETAAAVAQCAERCVNDTADKACTTHIIHTGPNRTRIDFKCKQKAKVIAHKPESKPTCIPASKDKKDKNTNKNTENKKDAKDTIKTPAPKKSSKDVAENALKEAAKDKVITLICANTEDKK